MFRSLRERLMRLEDSRGGALLLRAGLGLAFLALFPWDYRLTPVSFKAEDVDPVLLENAVKHAIATRTEGGTVRMAMNNLRSRLRRPFSYP